MVALAPFASRGPFETWILPRRHAARFEDVLARESAAASRGCWETCCGGWTGRCEQPPYSLVIHSAPVAEGHDFYHWHVEILPSVTRVGGLEWATGFHLNPTRARRRRQFLRDRSQRHFAP